MPKMLETTLRTMLSAQHADALAASNASKLSLARSDAMAYYNGDMSKDMPSPAGRSAAVSLDVQDTIEGIMPQLMEVFAGTDEVVKFEPVGPEDVQAAEQETDYINHVFMNQNPGFLVLYSFIKDALLSKVGVVKIWWEEDEREERETYLDKTVEEYALIVSDPDVEVVEHSEHEAEDQPVGSGMAGLPGEGIAAAPDAAGIGHNGQLGLAAGGQPETTLHDLTVVKKKKYARAKVMGVPPEEFGIERGARNIRDCNYCFHKVVDRTESDLIAQGYDERQVKALPSYRAWTNSEEINRDTVDENSTPGTDDTNTAARTVEITEHYIRMDYEGNGKPCLYRVTTGGSQGEVLKRDGKPDIEPFDAVPFAAMTPIVVTHRFYGKSLADLVMDIQRVKTALLRGGLDSIYQANNGKVVVAESHASENTLDDLLVSRPNQIVRVKTPGGIEYQKSIDVTPNVFAAMEYLDQIKETRTGVSKRGQGIEPDALSNQSATAAKIVENASQARVRLIARIFAETGIRDLFWLLHGTIKKHGQEAAVVRLRKNWVTVDPRQWKTREDLTIHVGLGTGGRAQRLLELNLIAQAQEKLLVGGYTNIITPEQLYSTGKAMVKAMQEPDVDAYFADPKTQPPLQPKQDPKVMALQMKAQLDQSADQRKAQIESVQAQADIATQDRKTQAEMAMAERKAQLDERLALIEHEAKMEEHRATIQMKREQHQQGMQHEDTKFQMDNHRSTAETNAKLAEKGMQAGPDGGVGAHPAVTDVLKAVADSHKELMKAVTATRKTRASKDKKTGEWQSVSEVSA